MTNSNQYQIAEEIYDICIELKRFLENMQKPLHLILAYEPLWLDDKARTSASNLVSLQYPDSIERISSIVYGIVQGWKGWSAVDSDDRRMDVVVREEVEYGDLFYNAKRLYKSLVDVYDSEMISAYDTLYNEFDIVMNSCEAIVNGEIAIIESLEMLNASHE